MSNRVTRIREILTRAFAPLALEIEDQSHLHAGHAGARDGRGHFHVRIVASAFAGQPLLARHRQVNAALADMLKTDIHALAIEARAPDESH
ncbi:MAG: BolA family transcriptional regulator [Proteobacteria bacterium]|nr:BolA family transcriptional regulator [Pseudomonadota bacterium]MCE7950718.1 BolA family transcriptional regulator [Xanthomonadales bacterium PRO7]